MNLHGVPFRLHLAQTSTDVKSSLRLSSLGLCLRRIWRSPNFQVVSDLLLFELTYMSASQFHTSSACVSSLFLPVCLSWICVRMCLGKMFADTSFVPNFWQQWESFPAFWATPGSTTFRKFRGRDCDLSLSTESRAFGSFGICMSIFQV